MLLGYTPPIHIINLMTSWHPSHIPHHSSLIIVICSSLLTELQVTCPYCETIHTLSELDEESLRQVAVGSREGGNYRCNVCNLSSGTELLLTSNSLFI